MKKLIALLSTGAVAGCVMTADMRSQLTSACNAAKSTFPAIDVLVAANKLNDKNVRRYAIARGTVSSVCDNPPTDMQGALYQLALTYVILTELQDE